MNDAPAARNRALIRAVWSSLLSKGGTAVLQLVSVPVAYDVLGPERFGIFATVQTLMWLIYLSDLGLGQGLTRRIARAHAADDRGAAAVASASAFFPTVLIASVILAATAWLVGTGSPAAFFGPEFLPHEAELRTSLQTGLLLFYVMLLTASVARIREGYQEMHVSNLFGAAANLTSAVVLLAGIRRVPEVWYVLVALYGVQALFILADAVQQVARRPWTWPRWRHFSAPLAGVLLLESLALFAVDVAPIVQREGGMFMLGHASGPDAVGLYAVLVQLSFILVGFVNMITRPLFPACAEAAARGDHAWLGTMRRRLTAGFLICTVLGTAFLALAGHRLIDLWMRRNIPLDDMDLALFGVAFCLMVWSQMHGIMLAGCGVLRPAAFVLGAETLVVLGLTTLTAGPWGVKGVLGSGIAGMLCFSAWMLPRLLRGALSGRLPAAVPDAPPAAEAAAITTPAA